MTLAEYRKAHGLTLKECAALIGVKCHISVHRYEKGTRTPTRAIMQNIIRATDGQVTADSFYPAAE